MNLQYLLYFPNETAKGYQNRRTFIVEFLKSEPQRQNIPPIPDTYAAAAGETLYTVLHPISSARVGIKCGRDLIDLLKGLKSK